jgi:hypothetical protein
MLLGLALAMLAGCAGIAPSGGRGPADVSFTPASRAEVRDAHDVEGATAAAHLQDRYDDTVVDCRKSADDPNPLPAVLCSGVLLRATKRGAGFDIWNPNLTNPQPNGVSFSWLRKDHTFTKLAYTLSDGFIILPHFFADDPSDGYTQLNVLCAFPMDGGTDSRRSPENDGCGPVPGIANTGPCQAQGITTSAQWMARFGNGTYYQRLCGFTMKRGTSMAYAVFAQMALIRTALGATALRVQNEIKVGAWPQNDSHIPLEAFFFISGDVAGLSAAKLNQQDFQARFNRWAPVVRLTLPTVMHGPASFVYDVSDQAIP